MTTNGTEAQTHIFGEYTCQSDIFILNYCFYYFVVFHMRGKVMRRARLSPLSNSIARIDGVVASLRYSCGMRASLFYFCSELYSMLL